MLRTKFPLLVRHAKWQVKTHKVLKTTDFISYKGFSQHNNKTTIMFTVLQRHVSTHMSHLQARTRLVYKVTL
jgi:hypothetical protein